MLLQVGAATDTGRVRELNEDVYMSRAEHGLFLVCDGMGGAPAGEVASQIAAQTIVEQLDRSGSGDAAQPGSGGYLPRTCRLAAAVRRANSVIYNQAQQDARQAEMGTTVVGVWIAQHVVSVAHVGDSRAYLWHDDHLEPLTCDHSLVEAQVRAGVLDREASLHAPHQNVLVRVLGREPDVEVDVNEVAVQAGDFVLLCSDGLTRTVSDAMLADAIARVRDPQRICDELIDAANRNGGSDNITVVVVQVADRWWRRIWSGRRRRPAGGE
jgi:protein phosphatase